MLKQPDSFQLELPPLVPAEFVQRLHRFGATVRLNGVEELAHVASSGRMTELLVPGARVWVEELTGRKSSCRLWLVEAAHGLVCINAQWPNRLAAEMFRRGFWPGPGPARFPPGDYPVVQPEYRYDRHRFDLRLQGPTGECIIEVKSVTLVEDGIALFPDAPSLRGSKHLNKLAEIQAPGRRTAALMLVQRHDAVVFRPNAQTDPRFATAMQQAAAAGVEVYALTCRVNPTAMAVQHLIPVELD